MTGFAQLLDRVNALATPEAAASSLHGPRHWRDVARCGLHIGVASGADLDVLLCFALLHDTQRLDDDEDPEHGPRAAALVPSLLADGSLPLSDGQVHLLAAACEQHTSALRLDNPTLGSCLDADRLTLWRCGVVPEPEYFSTDAGRRAAHAHWPQRLLTSADVSWQRIHGRYERAQGKPVA